MRLCERVLNTPAKTGLIGYVKPSSSLRFIAFSINLFHSLRVDFGWHLLTEDWAKRKNRRWIVEGFPTSAWKTMGLKSLPSKTKSSKKDLKHWQVELHIITDFELNDPLSHDELQAAALLPAGVAIAQKRPDDVVLCGMDPVITRDGDVLEGWIANPLTKMAT
jgi:hypothetical protein